MNRFSMNLAFVDQHEEFIPMVFFPNYAYYADDVGCSVLYIDIFNLRLP